jgi:curved DNA-binding protein CbpA
MSASKTKDFYKILGVSRTATTAEIKTQYRKLALSLHPDRHDGCKDKTQAFKDASEAYTILIDSERRQQYDASLSGWSSIPNGWYNKNRRTAPPKNYRKVYAPHAPPNGKWHDAQRHYDMHYGDGQMWEEINKAKKRAEARGDFEYHSPLGKGFTFGGGSFTSSENSYFKNPYSKAEQGPPKMHWEYEEEYISEAKTVLKSKRSVVERLHERREQRYAKEAERAEQQQQHSNPAFASQSRYTPYNETDAACTIM